MSEPYRVPPPNGYVMRLDPRFARAAERMGYDPETYRRQLNESTRRRLETESLAEGVDAIDAEYEVVQ